jgi:hemin uptake protein HemP
VLSAKNMQKETEVLEITEQDDLMLVNQKRQLSTTSLFGSSKEVAIVHGVDEYMLRITKQGKLILTK